ncbi:MAG: putative transcriptional regulator [Comamonadaceae bacterium]|nr:MAG: putative transcriptional regulator [Comamonadaceae bacterium]
MGAQWKAKHKDIAANAKGRIFGKLSKDIMLAARSGADPAANSHLRLLIEQARKASMPKDTLDRAIKKGAGLTGETVNFERVIYEGFAPHQVAVMVECLTDNLNRTAPEMRVLFRKGQLGTSGSVAWDFDHVGMIEAEPKTADVDPVLSAKLGYKPKNPVNPANLSAEHLEEVEAFLAAIDANDDVQHVYVALAG